MSDFCQLQLSCANKAEASEIASALLEKRLIACAKTMPVDSKFIWKGSVDSVHETLLIMETRTDLFEQVGNFIKSSHSYETPTLYAMAISKVSKDTENWLNESLKNG